MANFESIKTTIDNNITSNGRQSITGSVLNQVLHEMVDETESAIEILETAVESHDVEIEDLQENKVDKGSYEPTLSVGLSDNLVDRRDVVESEFTFRATGGGSINDGDAVVSGILGNSVVQDGAIINMTADGIKSVGFNAWDEQWENGGIDGQGGTTGTGTDRIRSKNYIKVLPNALYNITTSAPNANIFFYDAEKNFISYVIGKSFTTPVNCNYIKFVVGSSVYAVPTYNYDICINLAHTGYRNGEYQPYEESILDLSFLRDYFPNGMSSAGAAHDEIRYNKNINKWEKVVNVGAVKLKDLNWSRYQYQDKFSYFRAVANNCLPKCLQESIPNVLSVKYAATSSCATSSLVDKSITHYYYDAGVILLRDDEYEDIESFKNSLSDNDIIFCELAEPIVTEIKKSLNLVYKVCDFGTEQMLSSQPSSAIITKTTYAFNAVDKIRENARELTELSSQVGRVSEDVANKVDAAYVDNAINAAIGNVINGEY